jgi:cytochrome P450
MAGSYSTAPLARRRGRGSGGVHWPTMSRKSAPPGLGWEDVIGPDSYARDGYPHAAWRRLRREQPIAWFDPPGTPGFWAVTKRADIVWISKQPERFLNAPRLAVFVEGGTPPDPEKRVVRQLLNMDPPQHAEFRKVASSWFTPRATRRRRDEVERITSELLDALIERKEADFVGDFAAPLTLSVLADMLGVPRQDWELLFQWTNRFAGASDPEFQDADDPSHTVEKTRLEMFAYFLELAEARRRQPRDDMLSVLANARVDGAPIPTRELLSYCLLLVIAGNETTRNAASGGLLALLENPGEWRRLRTAPHLVDSAVEEIVRWTTPVIQFCRTPVEDVEIRGQQIRKGESLCLFYASANRDEEVFPDGDVFRVDRRPNPHVAFGIGEHFCLGANLARLELRSIFGQLRQRVAEVELTGPFERMRGSFLGGVKRMPIRVGKERSR